MVLAVIATLTLAACSAVPSAQLLALRAAPPVAPAAAARPSAETWLLLYPVRVPDYLDRDALLVAQGQAGLQPLPGYRWAEPLREAVPRVLRGDLAALLGEGRVWQAPLPAGVAATRLLRVELLAFEADAERAHVTLQARWTVADGGGASAPRAEAATLRIASAGRDADSLAAAHRLALWRLAERIAGAAPAP
jgi:uncharacterized lipoprotein YmbA